MSVLAVLLVQSKPEAPKIPSSGRPPTGLDAPGMWSVVAGSKGTTSYKVRSNVAGNAGLILVLLPLPVVGATPPIWPSFSAPCGVPTPLMLHQNWSRPGIFLQITPDEFALQVALTVHAGAWNDWAIQSPTE